MRKSIVMTMFLTVQLPIFYCQTETNYNGLIEYPLQKSVNNQYDSHLYKRFYDESLKTFEQTKNKLIEKVLSQEHVKRYIANNPSYVQTFIESLNDVNVLHNALMYSGIYLTIDGVDFYSSDTSIFRKLYENSLLKETNLRSSVSWSIYEFKTIPKTRAISYERPKVIRIEKGSLENGNYVMYYDPIYDYKTHKF